MNKFEYVASGSGYLRLYSKPVMSSVETQNKICDVFRILNKDNHKFSILFNAYTEESFGAKLKDHYKKSIYTIHSDSGGLQVVTRGSKITEELKNKIYGVQSKWSDIAMSFDEIPVNVHQQLINVNDIAARSFDIDNLEEKARLTGINVKKQVEFFIENKSTAKPVLILQGNCYDTFMRWFNYAISEIPQSYHKYIGGISIADTAHGIGLLEDIERAFVVGQLSSHFNNYYHLLGVGSVRKLLPYMVFMNNEYYKDIHISYDSTSHTGSVSRVEYLNNLSKKSLGKHYNHEYDICLEKMKKFNVDMKEINAVDFYNIINSHSGYYISNEKHIDNEKLMNYYTTRLSFFGLSVNDFTTNVDKINSSKNKIMNTSQKYRCLKEISSLFSIKNESDFFKWMKENKNTNKSTKVVTKNNIYNLDNFFED